jgi:hypothetical protein
MASLREQMMKVHEETDFVREYVGITGDNEFVYTHGGVVRPGLEYHIHYTRSKEEVYMTGGVHDETSRIIKKISVDFLDEKVRGIKTTYGKYSETKDLKRQNYPKYTRPNPTQSDYGIGVLNRYFAQKSNDTTSDISEISEKSFLTKNPLFRYISIQWRISGLREEVMRDNQRTIDNLTGVKRTKYEDGKEKLEVIDRNKSQLNGLLEKKLRPAQFYVAKEGSPEETENKLNLLKTF